MSFTIVVEWDASDAGTRPTAQRWVVSQYAGPYEGEGFVVGFGSTSQDTRGVAERLAAWLNWREGVE